MLNTINNILIEENADNLLPYKCIYKNTIVKQWLVIKGVIPYEKVHLKHTIILMCVFNVSSP